MRTDVPQRSRGPARPGPSLRARDEESEILRSPPTSSRLRPWRARAVLVVAELGEHALRLTPPGAHSDRHRRALAAARAERSAGEWTRARTILADLLADRRAGSWRAEALVLLAELESVGRSVPLLEEALRETSSPPVRDPLPTRVGDVSSRRPTMRRPRARRATRRRRARRRALAVQAILKWFAGEAEAPEDLPARAGDFERGVGRQHRARPPSSPEEEALLASTKSGASATSRGAPARSGVSPWVEFWAGRWALGAEYAARARDISVQYGLEVPQDLLPIAVIAVHRGQLELAREHSELALELSQAQFGLRPPHVAVLGLVARWSGDPSGAIDWLGEAERQAAAFRWGEPSVRWWSGDEIELLLELGRIEDAIRLLDVWEADAPRRPRVGVGPGDPMPWSCRRRSGSRSRRFPPPPGDCAARRSETPSARLVHCSGSASSGGGNGRSSAPARRSRLRSTVSNSSGPRPGSKRLGSELGRIGGRRREEVDACRASRRRPGCRRPHEPGGRRCAVRHGADGRRSLIHVYAKLGVRANGACPSAAVSISWRGGSLVSRFRSAEPAQRRHSADAAVRS